MQRRRFNNQPSDSIFIDSYDHPKVEHNDKKCDSMFKRSVKVVLAIIFVPILLFVAFSVGYDQWLVYYREGTYHIPHTKVITYASSQMPKIGSVEILSAEGGLLLNKKSQASVLGEGFKFVEGPVWNYYDSSSPSLLFSDIYDNCIYQWNAENGFSVFKYESGTSKYNAYTRKEPGSNGLAIDPISKDLFMCQHGDRHITRETLNYDENTSTSYSKSVLFEHFEEQTLNSPNDLAFNSKGDLFFTDPPYGLPTQTDYDSSKELPFNGVFRWDHTTKTLDLLYDNITRPNGIAVSPDQKYLYISNSDPEKKYWFRAELIDGYTPSSIAVFFNANGLPGEGLPDGLTVDSNGYLFATGPGGIHVFNNQAERIAIIHLPEAPTNVAFGDRDELGNIYLYITMQSKVLRIPTYSSGIMN